MILVCMVLVCMVLVNECLKNVLKRKKIFDSYFLIILENCLRVGRNAIKMNGSGEWRL
jgi:hypothetical protein